MQGGTVAAAIRDVYTSLLACSASNDYPVCARKAPKFRGQKKLCRACPHPYYRHRV